jgi:hypothetical protein
MPQSGREWQFLFLQAKCLKLQTFQAPKIINCLHRLFVCLIVVVIMLNLSQKMVKKHKCCSFYFYCQTYFVMLRHGCYIVTCNLFGDCRLLRPPYVKILAPPLHMRLHVRAAWNACIVWSCFAVLAEWPGKSASTTGTTLWSCCSAPSS